MYYAHLGGLQVIHEEYMQILTKFKCLGDLRSISMDRKNTKLHILSSVDGGGHVLSCIALSGS